MWEQMITEVRRRHHAGIHVAAGRRVVLEDEVEVDDLQHGEGRAANDDQRREVSGDPLVRSTARRASNVAGADARHNPF